VQNRAGRRRGRLRLRSSLAEEIVYLSDNLDVLILSYPIDIFLIAIFAVLAQILI
jgi:hypothetical protein